MTAKTGAPVCRRKRAVWKPAWFNCRSTRSASTGRRKGPSSTVKRARAGVGGASSAAKADGRAAGPTGSGRPTPPAFPTAFGVSPKTGDSTLGFSIGFAAALAFSAGLAAAGGGDTAASGAGAGSRSGGRAGGNAGKLGATGTGAGASGVWSFCQNCARGRGDLGCASLRRGRTARLPTSVAAEEPLEERARPPQALLVGIDDGFLAVVVGVVVCVCVPGDLRLDVVEDHAPDLAADVLDVDLGPPENEPPDLSRLVDQDHAVGL